MGLGNLFIKEIFIFMAFVTSLSPTSNRSIEGILGMVLLAPSVSIEEEEYQRKKVTCQRSHSKYHLV